MELAPGGKEHGTAGCGLFRQPGTDSTGGRRIGNRAFLPREKAKPLLAKIVKVLRALYLAYVELKGKFERLQADYGQVQKANSRLSERLQEVKLENKSLRRTSADYAQLKQILGAEQIEATLS